MTLLRATQCVSVCLVCMLCWSRQGHSQSIAVTPIVATSAATVSQFPAATRANRAFPRIDLGGGLGLRYVGMFSPDAVYRATSKLTAVNGRVPGEGIPPAPSSHESPRASEAPNWMLLSNERVAENFELPAHAEAVAQAHSQMGVARNHFVTYIYGRPSVIHAPHHIAVDSLRRLIISDSDARAVHVLDPSGRNSFRLASGKGCRLHEPAGVAVDADDNIYVADSEHGMIVVFDRNGNFIRYLSNDHGEPEYAAPHGLAIDPAKRHLILADTPRSLIFVLDLNGKVVKRLGKYRNGIGTGEFDHPTDIAVNHNQIFILDRWGTRVQVMDLQWNLVGRFDLVHGIDLQPNRDNGLGADDEGNVYVSSFDKSVIGVYNQGGHLLSSFGLPGQRAGEFTSPEGLWIDSADRLYVADSGNGRVQLFQITPVH